MAFSVPGPRSGRACAASGWGPGRWSARPGSTPWARTENGLGHAHPLLEAPRQGGDRVQQFAQCNSVSRTARAHGIASATPRKGRFQDGRVVQVVGHRHVGVYRAGFPAGSPACAVRRGVARSARSMPAMVNVTAGGLQVSAQHFHDGGFAGAVVAQQADDLTGRECRRTDPRPRREIRRRSRDSSYQRSIMYQATPVRFLKKAHLLSRFSMQISSPPDPLWDRGRGIPTVPRICSMANVPVRRKTAT